MMNTAVREDGSPTPAILLTIDVEDWFQVENFKPWIPFSSWPERELRVERNTNTLLDLLDMVDSGSATGPKKPRATFFILGWIAERIPGLVREIYNRGHEVASHGYDHDLCNQIKGEALTSDLTRSKQLLEDITGERVNGYRAPSFSIDHESLLSIRQSGYLYDSSYNSFQMNERYGYLDLTEYQKRGGAYQISDEFFEIAISNLKLKRVNFELPWGGGGYFRLIPWFLFKKGVKKNLARDFVYVLYLHPWEIDSEQPRVNEASAFFKFRHYINLDKTYRKLLKLIQTFKYCKFISCSDYVRGIS